MAARWPASSLPANSYSGSPESTFDFDIRQISNRGLMAYVQAVLANELPDSFWTGMLPQLMNTSSIKSPYFLCYQAAQVKLGDRGFLSRDITVTDLLLNRADVHHVYPRKHLKGLNHASSSYNQIANFVVAQSDREEFLKNLRMNCIPETLLDGEIKSYEAFLEDRRKLMALRIKTWFEALG